LAGGLLLALDDQLAARRADIAAAALADGDMDPMSRKDRGEMTDAIV
jgi:hypothetical protein